MTTIVEKTFEIFIQTVILSGQGILKNEKEVGLKSFTRRIGNSAVLTIQKKNHMEDNTEDHMETIKEPYGRPTYG